jgi:hypothetical protein
MFTRRYGTPLHCPATGGLAPSIIPGSHRKARDSPPIAVLGRQYTIRCSYVNLAPLPQACCAAAGMGAGERARRPSRSRNGRRHSAIATGAPVLSLVLPSRRPIRSGSPSLLTPRLKSTCFRSSCLSLLCPYAGRSGTGSCCACGLPPAPSVASHGRSSPRKERPHTSRAMLNSSTWTPTALGAMSRGRIMSISPCLHPTLDDDVTQCSDQRTPTDVQRINISLVRVLLCVKLY